MNRERVESPESRIVQSPESKVQSPKLEVQRSKMKSEDASSPRLWRAGEGEKAKVQMPKAKSGKKKEGLPRRRLR